MPSFGTDEDKMQSYFGNQISTRLSTTPEGFLIAQGAVLCRSGFQTYRGVELNLSDFNGQVEVYRPPEEVLAPAFLASLEGKCVTDSHPTQFVDSSNARWVCSGHCQHVRQGPALANGDVTVIGDLVVTDENLIRKIANGQRELSVGYEYKLRENEDGDFEMRDLVANHIACVETGRAGSARILDHDLQAAGRACSCPRELARIADRDDVAEINFVAAARRFLGKNIMEVGRKNR
jgi:hypothetical protein